MSRRFIYLLGVLVASWSAGDVWAQGEGFLAPERPTGQLPLLTVAPYAALPAAPVLPGAGAWGPGPALVAPPMLTGPVQLLDAGSGAPLSPGALAPYFGATDPNTASKLVTHLGFDYIHPFWSNQNFTLGVPAGSNGTTTLLGDARDVTQNFGIAPVLDFRYQLLGPALGIQASGSIVQLTGNLQRTVTSPAGTGNLTARETLALAYANVGEVTTTLLFKNWDNPCIQNSHLQYASLLLSLGPRYSSIQQSFDATLASGPNTANLHSDQSFNGFGLTSSAYFLLPISSNFRFYDKCRASVLVGDNVRNASYFVVAPDNPAASTSSTFRETRTTFLPIEQFEVGIDWGKQLPRWTYTDPNTPALVWIRAGFTAQIWGDAGMFSPINSPAFRNSTLYLLGFTMMLGFQR